MYAALKSNECGDSLVGGACHYVAVIVTNALLRDYMINYARTLIYTTSLSYASVIAADCSFDILDDGTGEKVHFSLSLGYYVLLIHNS